jgi:hypothetical protein
MLFNLFNKKTYLIKPYDATGYSKESLIKACISFDYHLIKKIPHPKTYIEILNEQTNKENNKQFKKDNASEKAIHKELYAHFKLKPILFND